ncbi:hypothetical protein CHGG_01492 [Chaetomium globosum CBS 148.51]|uniref:Uncharacterized protein n=1 Tax=Chaetomium globosum (strain ATCC 6205 / CBS 148.51 / DSM 1962 / NBRC 6347 / NRRL 1970) TaxID=306901 RepID=Q2HE62_CHAGB|nr:uncharacterized protein CHGG_01492 [Chaetomium globosum CBS 148.51]EAQ93257.1 hypothetical protein CHGG_01492 [Chaetomium globosum CBS 148.51]
MTPPASQCRRALQRQIVPSKDSIWITDGLLASAFERYCCVSRTWNRKASNVPGPLESQRRLGRRRMGDASTWHCPPTPPSWAFLAPLNLTQWTWKPPSLAPTRERNQLRHDDNTSTEPIPLLPRLLRESAPQGAERPLAASTSAALHDPSLSPVVTTPSDPYAALMGGFRWAVTHADDERLASYTGKLCSRLRHLIVLGEIPPNDVLPLSKEVWDMLGFQPTIRSVTFFVKVMASMPMTHRPDVYDGVLSVLGCFFSTWNYSRVTVGGSETRRLMDIAILGELYEKQQKLSALPACLRQAKAISGTLQGTTPEETKQLLAAAHRLVFAATGAWQTGRHNLRYSWLYMLAQNSHVNEDFIFDAAASLSHSSLNIQPLSIVEVSSLLLTQWASRGYLKAPKDVYRAYRRHRGKRDEAALAALFLGVFSRGKGETRKGLYRSAWKLLTKLQQTDYVMRSLLFDTLTGKLPVRMLEDLAYTSNDHLTAIHLRDLWSQEVRTKDQPQWFPGAFDKYAENIVRDPKIPPKEIWRVLDIGKLEQQGTTFKSKIQRHRGAFGRRRAAVVEKVAKAFMEAPHLSSRATLRHVSRSFAFLKVIRGKVPDFIIQDMYRIVTKDLWEEKPGRTKRLLWFLRIVERRHGLEMAWSCRLALRRWRARLLQNWISKGGGRQF